jgi:hypothetical protein
MVVALVFLQPVNSLSQSIPPGTGRSGISSKNAKLATKTSPVGPVAAGAAPPAVAPPAGTVTVSSLSPFTATVNVASASQTLKIVNVHSTDSYAVALSSISGASFPDFHVTLCASPTLLPKGQCDVAVVYQPSAVATSSATITFTATDQTNAAVVTFSVPLSGASTAQCPQPNHPYLPLSQTGVTNAMINCYFNTTSNLAFVTEAQYLYNPGQTANTISGNLASLQFPGGVQLTLAGNANTSSCSGASVGSTSSGSTTTTNATSSTCGTMPSGSSTPSLQQDEQTLTQGGPIALKALWPILNLREPFLQVMSVAAPKLGFDVSGLSTQGTATGATDVNGNLSSETYFELDAIPAAAGGESPGAIFADYRVGWEHVSSTFATAAGLTGGNNFTLQQLSGGLVINGFLRISAQRYFGPEQAYVTSSGSTATVNNFKSWQLAIQLVPSNVKTKN